MLRPRKSSAEVQAVNALQENDAALQPGDYQKSLDKPSSSKQATQEILPSTTVPVKASGSLCF